MTALAHERPEVSEMTEMPEFEDDLDEVLWQAWKTLELPEGYHAEIVEGFIEVSPTGRRRHTVIANKFRRSMDRFLEGTGRAAYQDGNVLHERKALIPDLFVAPEELDDAPDEDGLGVPAEAVDLVVEVVSPGRDATDRDRVRKRRAYARAGIPVYVLIDDFDGHGTVSVLTSPSPQEAVYAAEIRTPYGAEVEIPDGPAKGFVIGKEITGEPQG